MTKEAFEKIAAGIEDAARGLGIYHNMPAAEYHADPCERPSLSSSIAKILIEKTPRHAWHAHPRLNPDFVAKKEDKFDLGSAVHELMLGKGVGYTIVKAADYKSKDAQAARQRAREEGRIPLLHTQYLQAMGIAREALAALAEMDVHLEAYRNEAVLIWENQGLPCRAMIDSLGPGICQILDIKTTAGGMSESALNRMIVNCGYDVSAAFYIKGLEALFQEVAGRIVFTWIFVETEPPYEVVVMDADATTLHYGNRKCEWALANWARCMASEQWPGYPRVRRKSNYPSWAESTWLEREREEAGIE